ncbi:MAG TPA: hypothetical protein VLE23_17455 [Geminicoccaceae bacterium]|nr:hypothetical protein [Geminicoccaceae bacterium]
MTVKHALAPLAAAWLLAGCAGFGEGIARGLLAETQEPGEDTRLCEVSGPAFAGILPLLERQQGHPPLGQAGADRPILKVIMVHGVGTHVPGYGARLAANLAQALGLTVIAPEPKEFTIEAPAFPGEALGELTVTRHTNAARDREMLFFELTWSPISQPAKEGYAFDSTEVYAYRRASLNNVFKTFVNDVSADPLVYTGTGRDRIQTAVGQALCWALSADWESLPDEQQLCTPDSPNFASRLEVDEFAFITHSLGSRITTDGLQRLTRVLEEEGRNRPAVRRVVQAFKERDVKVFMLANQLPLLQSGLEPASIRDAVPAYCRPDGAHYADRLFQETELIAFSDPNDLLSYPIPDAFVREHVDSRLCPRQVNVTINIAPVTNLLGVGEFANPLAAHLDYDDDERVIGLITRGIGQPETAPVVKERCTWLEVAEDLR